MRSLIALFALTFAALGAPALAGPTFQHGEEVKVTGTHDNISFAAGGDITVDATIPDTLFAAGGDLDFNGAQLQSLITAGGDFKFENSTIGDLIIAGGDLSFISGTVTDDAVIAGGDISLEQNFNINDTAIISGGEIQLDGTIGGSAHIRGGEIKLSGAINGDADLAGGRIVIGPGAKIGGNLVYRARVAEISPQATITGTVTKLPYNYDREHALAGLLVGGLIVGMLIYFIGTAVLALGLAALAPGLMSATRARIMEHPLSTIGIAILWVVIVPVLSAILFATLIGIPLGAVLIGLYLLAFPIGGAVAVHFTGMLIRGWFGGKDEPGLGARLGWTLLGALVLCALGLVPLAGALLWPVACLFGLGALVSALGAYRHAPPAVA